MYYIIGHLGFGMPRNQIFDFKPSKLDSKNFEDDVVCVPTTLTIGAVLNYVRSKIYMILLKPLALMLQASARLLYAIFYFACNSTPTVDRRHFSKPNIM